jgi:hypothetical protein
MLMALPTSLELRRQDLVRVGDGAATAIGGIAAALLVHQAISIYGEAISSGISGAVNAADAYLALTIANIQVIARAAARELARSLRVRMIPIFPVFRVLWPSIYAWRTGPTGIGLPRNLNYAGPITMAGIPLMRTNNRALARANYFAAGGLPGPIWFDFDEYPYASTFQGGALATGAFVPFGENRSEGAMLGIFYRVALRNIPGSAFLVVDIP